MKNRSGEFSYETMCGNRRLVWGSRTYIMGVVNVSHDSFSGDGIRDVSAAVAQAQRFVEEGADIIDIGGESTRAIEGDPKYTRISEDDELRRVIPVLENLVSRISNPISVDTYKPKVARFALEAGASMLNDIWGLRFDVAMAELAALHQIPMVLMHNQDEVLYSDLLSEVKDSLKKSVWKAKQVGLKDENIILDPGIGFAKSTKDSLEIIRRLKEIKDLGYPILLGTSRKSFIGSVLDLPVEQRLEGSSASVALAIANGADIVRVHDVKAMTRVARMADAVVRG